MQRTYEIMFIVRPDMGDEDLDRLLSTFEGQVGTAGATVKSSERMGKRRLAYVVRGFQEGIYILFTVESGSGEIVRELERRLRVTEPVIKFMTVRTDEREKRLEKMRKHRESHQRARPAPPVEAEPAGAGAEPAPAAV